MKTHAETSHPVLLLWIAIFGSCLSLVSTNLIPEDAFFNFTFAPPEIDEILDNEELDVYFNLTFSCCPEANLSVTIRADDPTIARVSKNNFFYLPEEPEDDQLGSTSGYFTVEGESLGLTHLTFTITANEESNHVIQQGYRVIVRRARYIQDDIFRYGIIVLSSILYVGFGCQLDLNVIWKIIKRPVAPAIGAACQFIIMPLLGFAVAKMLSFEDPYAFGLLTMACSPGGGGSNVWSNLLRGDLDLSLTMTFISTMLALGMMPLWMFTLGRYFIDSERIEIEYMLIFRSLLIIVVPCVIGIIIRKVFPKIGPHVKTFTKPFSAIFIIFIVTLGTYANWYMYVIMGQMPIVIVGAVLLPYLGFLFGALMAKLVCQSKARIITIAIETGVQNASIPIIMLQGNFPQPEGDLGAVIPQATALFTPVPLYFATIGLVIYDRCFRDKSVEDTLDAKMEGKTSIDLEAVPSEGYDNSGMTGEENGDLQQEKKTAIQNGVAPQLQGDGPGIGSYRKVAPLDN